MNDKFDNGRMAPCYITSNKRDKPQCSVRQNYRDTAETKKNSKRGAVLSVYLEGSRNVPQIHNINRNCVKVALIVEYIFVGKFKPRKDSPDNELEDNWDCQDEYFRVLFVQRICYDEEIKNDKELEKRFRKDSSGHTS